MPPFGLRTGVRFSSPPPEKSTRKRVFFNEAAPAGRMKECRNEVAPAGRIGGGFASFCGSAAKLHVCRRQTLHFERSEMLHSMLLPHLKFLPLDAQREYLMTEQAKNDAVKELTQLFSVIQRKG